jgi:tRNA 2-selenouridine synthase
MRQSQSITIDEYLAAPERFSDVIDVRAPSEFALDHLPGALALSVLNDPEREQIGTLHKQVGSFEAKRAGAALVAKNIAHMLETALAVKPIDWKPLVYCWRGGQRSNSLATIMARIGWKTAVLEGGYKAIRNQVLAQLQILPESLELRVICGRTGTGKSVLLNELAAQDAQVLDLEALACHRGSVLGHLPQTPQPSQKWFETQVWWALRQFDPKRPVYLESESKKIGAVQVPEALMNKMRASECIEVSAAIPARSELLLAQYQHFMATKDGMAALHGQLDCLVSLHGAKRVQEWKDLTNALDWHGFVERVLVEHYDPAYDKSIDRNFVHRANARQIALVQLDGASIASAAKQILS